MENKDICAFPDCGKELTHKEGRKKRKYCSPACGRKNWGRLNYSPSNKKKKYLPLPPDFMNVTKIGIIDDKGKITDLLSEDGKTFLLSSPDVLKIAYRSLFESVGICKTSVYQSVDKDLKVTESKTPTSATIQINTTPKHPLFKEGDPKENSLAFINKFGVANYDDENFKR